MSGYIDGTYSTAFLTSNVVSYPFTWPNNSTVAQFELEYIQLQSSYTAAALDSTSGDAPGSALLVEQGPLRKIGAGLVRFKRVYCQIPQLWVETQQVAYTFPGLSGPPAASVNNWSASFYRAPITLYAIATVTHEFSHGGTAPTLDNTFIALDGVSSNFVVQYIGTSNPAINPAGVTSPSAEPSTYNVSSESHLIRGLIWEKISMTVPKPI